MRRSLSGIQIDTKISDLAKSMFYSKKTISESINLLLENKLILRTPLKGRKGRPIYLYTIPQNTLDLEKSIKLINQLYIDDLITSAADERTHNKLKNTNKLLLIVLLAHANKFGVADSISKKQLLNITGMSEDKLDYQLSRLSRLGYINYVYAGASGKHLFGVVKSSYSLNLGSNYYSKNISNVKVFYFEAANKVNHCDIGKHANFESIDKLVTRHIECFRLINMNHRKSRVNTKRELKKFFNESDFLLLDYKQVECLTLLSFENVILPLIQKKIYDISSTLLSQHYKDLSYEFKNDEMCKKIRANSFSKSVLNSLENKVEGEVNIMEGATNLLVSLLYNIGLTHSLMIKDIIESIKSENIKIEDADFYIHSSNILTERFCIYVSTNCLNKKYIVINNIIQNHNDKQKVLKEGFSDLQCNTPQSILARYKAKLTKFNLLDNEIKYRELYFPKGRYTKFKPWK